MLQTGRIRDFSIRIVLYCERWEMPAKRHSDDSGFGIDDSHSEKNTTWFTSSAYTRFGANHGVLPTDYTYEYEISMNMNARIIAIIVTPGPIIMPSSRIYVRRNCLVVLFFCVLICVVFFLALLRFCCQSQTMLYTMQMFCVHSSCYCINTVKYSCSELRVTKEQMSVSLALNEFRLIMLVLWHFVCITNIWRVLCLSRTPIIALSKTKPING